MEQPPNPNAPDPNDPHFDPSTLISRAGCRWAGDDLQNAFRGEVADLLGRHNRSFPGAQPVSFSASHFAELKQADYYVCEKTDGTRYLMWSTNDGGRNIVYLIDRKNDYYYMEKIYLPHHENKPGMFDKFHDQTILDGELVEDHIPGQKSVRKFLVFDCLVLDGNVLMHRPLDKRLGYFKSFVLGPWKAWYKYMEKHDPDYLLMHPPDNLPPDMPFRPFSFQIEDKSTEFSYGLEKMFKEIIPKVKQLHGNDGLIFTCRDTPYHPGTDPHILKWKPPEENTVDFLLHINWKILKPDPEDPDQSIQQDYLAFPDDFSLYIFYGDRQGQAQYERHASLYVTVEEWEELKALNRPLQDCIVECFQEEVNGIKSNGFPQSQRSGSQDGMNGTSTRRWRFHRFRDDKAEANHVSTFNSVIDSIEDHVTEDDLLKQAEDIRTCWKARAAKSGQQGPRPSQQGR